MDPLDQFDIVHRRYLEQSSWTEGIRRQLLPLSQVRAGSRILEVGAGTGAVVGPMKDASPELFFHALDANQAVTRAGAGRYPGVHWQVGDAHRLPLRSESFEAVFFHYVLLWLEDPEKALAEAVRVTRPGGSVLAFAEPDHQARIDFPDALAPWGERQTRSLQDDGADVQMGRRLRTLFARSGLDHVQSGILGAEWDAGAIPGGSQIERETLRADLEGRIPPAELDAYEAAEAGAWERGERVLFVPTFYAAGRVS